MTDPELRVLLLAGRLEVRGRSRQTMHLSRLLPEHRVKPSLLCSDARVITKAQREGIDVQEVTYLQSPLFGRIAEALAARDMEDDPPDLIHIQHRGVLSIGRRLAYRLERPYVVSIHDYLGPRELLRFEWQWCRGIIAVSESVKNELTENSRIPAERITVIHSGVNAPPADAIGEVLQPNRAPVIGTAGPLEAVKGLRYFIDAAPLVMAEHPEVEFLIAGAGPEERNLRRQVQELGIAQHVTFVPAMMDLHNSLMAMDVFVLPSLKQGLGTIMLEAMVRSRPVIATGAGGVYSAVADNQTGLLVPPRDSAALAARVNELLNDPLRARRIGRTARETVMASFPVERMVAQTATLYRGVLHPGPPRPSVVAE
jgi:glycosyltransferase involved in cell wall biosynthesis